MKISLQSTSQPIRSVRGLVICCIRQWALQLVALAATAAVIAVVIGGSLGVGDSIQQGLRRMVSQRIGGIAAVIIGREPFGKQFTERLYLSCWQKIFLVFSG